MSVAIEAIVGRLGEVNRTSDSDLLARSSGATGDIEPPECLVDDPRPERNRGAGLYFVAADDFGMQRVFRVGTHARNIQVACVRGAAGIQTGAPRQSFALPLEGDSKLAAVGTCRKAEERDQRMGRVATPAESARLHAELIRNGSSASPVCFVFVLRTVTLTRASCSYNSGDPGELRLTAEVANDVERPAFAGDAQPVSQEARVLFRLAFVFPDGSDSDNRSYRLRETAVP